MLSRSVALKWLIMLYYNVVVGYWTDVETCLDYWLVKHKYFFVILNNLSKYILFSKVFGETLASLRGALTLGMFLLSIRYTTQKYPSASIFSPFSILEVSKF